MGFSSENQIFIKVQMRSFCKKAGDTDVPVNINDGVSFGVDIVMRLFVFVFVHFY